MSLNQENNPENQNRGAYGKAVALSRHFPYQREKCPKDLLSVNTYAILIEPSTHSPEAQLKPVAIV